MSKTAFSLLFFTSKEIRFQSSQEDSSQNYSSQWPTKTCQCSVHSQVPNQGEKLATRKSQDNKIQKISSHKSSVILYYETQKKKKNPRKASGLISCWREKFLHKQNHTAPSFDILQMNKDIKEGPCNLPPLAQLLLRAFTLDRKSVV